MKKIIVAIPFSHTWLWGQTCIASLMRNPPCADGFDVKTVIIDNSPWSPAIKGIRNTALGNLENLSIIDNHKTNKFHASALDCVVEKMEFDYLMALETDVLALRPTWLQWFVDQLRDTDFAVGHWHHEQFINPSCTMYRGSVLRDMLLWCETKAPQDELRWGPSFENSSPLDNSIRLAEHPAEVLHSMKEWISGPFAEKRGWPAGTKLKEQPSGQLKGPGWYEPGQQLHHWAVEAGYTYTECPTTTICRLDSVPLATQYGVGKGETTLYPINLDEQEVCQYSYIPTIQTVHFWGGTRALDILKHPVTCNFVKSNTPGWLAREARFWRDTVPVPVQAQTLDLIRKHGFHITGQGTDYVTDRDKEAADFVRACYREGGVYI